MDCLIEGCKREATRVVGSKDEYHFCSGHLEAWGYYRSGYYSGKGFGCDGLLRKKVWEAAMKDFLELCRVEISACAQIAESLIKEGRL